MDNSEGGKLTSLIKRDYIPASPTMHCKTGRRRWGRGERLHFTLKAPKV